MLVAKLVKIGEVFVKLLIILNFEFKSILKILINAVLIWVLIILLHKKYNIKNNNNGTSD